MAQLHKLLLSMIVAIFTGICRADVGFSSPAAGATISGSTIDVKFTNGAGDPPLTSFSSYSLQLCAGGNVEADYITLATFTSTGDFTDLTYTADIPDLSVGDNTKNAYFLRTIGVVKTGGVVYNFSPRFTLSGMTGQFPANVITALGKISGTAGPPTVNQVNAAPAADPAAPQGAFGVAYTMQTGPMRYAPMAKEAPSKITAKGNARQFPTSGYSVWSRSGMPLPNASKTVTDAYTYIYSSMEPTNAAASQPGGDDMQKFLNRWKD